MPHWTRRAAGPLVVVGRPRSGTRLVAQLLANAGVFMGADQSTSYRDSLSWFLRFSVPLITSAWFPNWPDFDSTTAFAQFCRDRLADTMIRFQAAENPGDVWGWKYPETLFVMPVVKRLFPKTKFIHVIRDGRDVCLSQRGCFQLSGPHAEFADWDVPAQVSTSAMCGEVSTPTYREYCLAVAFGSKTTTHWHGIDLADPAKLLANRFLLQMQSWVHCVNSARSSGRALAEDYIEIRYEELCERPCEVVGELFARLELPKKEARLAVLSSNITTDAQIGWQRRQLTLSEDRDFHNAVDHGSVLLRELGYA